MGIAETVEWLQRECRQGKFHLAVNVTIRWGPGQREGASGGLVDERRQGCQWARCMPAPMCGIPRPAEA